MSRERVIRVILIPFALVHRRVRIMPLFKTSPGRRALYRLVDRRVLWVVILQGVRLGPVTVTCCILGRSKLLRLLIIIESLLCR